LLNARFLLALLDHVTCNYFWQYDHVMESLLIMW